MYSIYSGDIIPISINSVNAHWTSGRSRAFVEKISNVIGRDFKKGAPGRPRKIKLYYVPGIPGFAMGIKRAPHDPSLVYHNFAKGPADIALVVSDREHKSVLGSFPVEP